MINKEFGSDFHYVDGKSSDAPLLFESEKMSLFFSGRVALYNLLSFGIQKYKWKKVGFPSYYCHEVVDFCKNLPLEIGYYNYNPFSDIQKVEWDDETGNVFVCVDFFGIEKLNTTFLKQSVVIDDLTHSLLSIKDSKADYCFGSLRKQLPVGAGGFCLGLKEDITLTVPVNSFVNKLALQKLTAMFLKSEYLLGKIVNKDIFRNLYIEAESQFELLKTNSTLPEIIKLQLFAINEESLIQQTIKNIIQAKTKLQLKQCKIIESNRKSDFALILLFDECVLRNHFRSYLIENKIFPAILWPSQKTERDIFYENRVLLIHLDFRYSQEDIEYMVLKINEFFRNV